MNATLITETMTEKSERGAIREHCRGMIPLDAKLQPWMTELFDSGGLHALVAQHGSPLNVVKTGPFRENISGLQQTASQRGIDFDVYFARKANKCLAFVDAARDIGCGIDTASLQEVEQVLACGVRGEKIICTAAVKSRELMERCVGDGVVIAIDNHDELSLVAAVGRKLSVAPQIALRVSGFDFEGSALQSRFGLPIDRVVDFVQRHLSAPRKNAPGHLPELVGLHFHLDGYCRHQRAAAIRQLLPLIDELREIGHAIEFLDIGGGFPMSYLESEEQWRNFWQEHRRALLGEQPPVTYQNHGLGLIVVNGEVHGMPKSYPFFQSPVQQEWFAQLLDADCSGEPIRAAIRRRSLQLRCEPGRSILDGCGFTVARVEFRKQQSDGEWLIGLSMNRTQCRTSSDDFLVDPIVIPSPDADRPGSMTGYLVGAYCTESELLSLRQLHFPHGVARGDLVVFPNTAGYLMHFLESRSHQFPLAQNLVVADDDILDLNTDRIDDA